VLVREAGAGSVGIGMPGAVSQVTGLVKNANSTWLNGKPLKQDLEKALGREVRLENDANCFALSEASDGAGKGAPVVFGVILGTGVGGGIVVNGRVLTGANAIAGEWGHNPLPLPETEGLPELRRAMADWDCRAVSSDSRAIAMPSSRASSRGSRAALP